ncbi:uncharacterized protein LOC113343814 [Papaver somniferum]|uniref:uncharacterized protein LOC113343814 n=1 Tax=Papaver somniferum TaxID=3469 RepID=UPI000E6FCD57|nr:uncharacterized protein LOC113343814 [Papaver somniferum]
MYPFGNNTYGSEDHTYYGNNSDFQSHSYNSFQPYVGYSQNQSFGYDDYSTRPCDFSHTSQQLFGGYVSGQSQGWGDSYTSHTFQSSFLQMPNEFMDLRRTWNQINSTPNVPSFIPSETYDSVFRPVPDHTYDPSPIQREYTWSKEPIVNSSGKRVNIKKLFKQYEQLEDEGATEETLQAIIRAIHDEVNRRVDNGEEPQVEDSEDDEPLENIDNDGATSSTHDYNDHSHILEEEVESRNTTIIDGKTYVVYEGDDDYDFFVHHALNSEIVDTLNEKSTCEEHKDYDNLLMEDSDSFYDEEDLVIEETNECLNKNSSENDDTCDVRMEVSSSTEDLVIHEVMQGLSNPLHEPLSNDDPPKLIVVSQRVVNPSFRKIPHLGLELCAYKVLRISCFQVSTICV